MTLATVVSLFFIALAWQAIGIMILGMDSSPNSPEPSAARIMAALFLGPLILPLRLVFHLLSRLN